MSDAGDEIEGDSLNLDMKFVTGGDTSTFTKTPANVPRDHFARFELRESTGTTGESSSKKRKPGAGHASGAASKRVKGK